jgi:hypothetical protein
MDWKTAGGATRKMRRDGRKRGGGVGGSDLSEGIRISVRVYICEIQNAILPDCLPTYLDIRRHLVCGLPFKRLLLLVKMLFSSLPSPFSYPPSTCCGCR